MPKYTIDGTTLSDVADAVRELDGNPDTMTPAQMASRIRAVQPGGADLSVIADDYDTTATYDVGEYCIYDGGLYVCNTAISTAEAWTVAHWTEVTVGDELSDVKSDLSHSQAYLKQLALNGYFDESASEDTYLHLTSGQINNGGGTNSDSGKGYIWLTSAQEQETIEINPDYSYNLCYMNGETVAKYTTWQTASPIVFDGTTHTKIGITAKKTAGGDITNLLDTIIYIPGGDGDRVGNLATKDYAVSQQQDVADAGKILVIDNSGNVVPGDVPESVVIDDSLSVADDAADAKATGDRIDELATNGFITKGATVMFYNLTLGMADSDSSGTLPIEQTIRQVTNTAYVIVPKTDLVYPIYYDNTKYKVNTIFVKDNHQVPGTFKAWQTTSPVQYAVPSSYDSMLINVRKLSGNFTTSELSETLYKNPVVVVGDLVTHADLKKFNPQGRKIIYPDGYVSRIKPDIYYSGRYYADIDTDDYKISGTGSLWVSLDGNDSTGDGSEEKPYLTITKALAQSGSTICIKEGTYIQGTHFSVSLGENRNFVGIGNVVLQGDSSGHYIATSGSVYFENIIFEFGSQSVSNPTVSAYCSASGKTACFVKCTFRNGGTNGLGIGGIDVVCKDCVAYGNKLDGFNYHARTVSDVTYIPNVIEIDCVAYNNGSSESGNNSCNGSTAHDGVKIIRLNGEYYSCYGGVIAEIGLADDEPTVSLNYGVLAHDSTGTGTYKASFWASVNAQVYLYDCCSYGGDYDLSAINDGKIVSRRLTTGRDVPSVNTASTATVIQY